MTQWMRSVAAAALVAVLGAGAGAEPARAAVHGEAVEYKDGDKLLEGYLAWDDAGGDAKRPGVLVAHEWMGHDEYVRERARQLAGMGYVALAIDMYGKGIHAKDHDEAGKLSGAFRNDRKLMRGRAAAALEVLRAQKLVDPRRIAAIGYCFGGMSMLELARSGADLAAVVSFHGGLDTPHPEDAKNVKAKILVCQGGDDKFTLGGLAGFEDEMRKAGVDYQVNIYGGAVHSFTVPAAGNDASKGMAYNPAADRRSWDAMKLLFVEVFK